MIPPFEIDPPLQPIFTSVVCSTHAHFNFHLFQICLPRLTSLSPSLYTAFYYVPDNTYIVHFTYKILLPLMSYFNSFTDSFKSRTTFSSSSSSYCFQTWPLVSSN